MFNEWFVSCPRGLEGLLGDELAQLGLHSRRETVAGVALQCALRDAYVVCLWSRLANRVLLPLATFPVASADDIYAGASAVNWSEHFGAEATFVVDFVGTGSGIDNSHYGALRVKDAVIDYFRRTTGERPSIEQQTPDIRLNMRLAQGMATLSLDFSGGSLHRRNYRVEGMSAPLKENLAAAILIRAGWPAIAASGGALIDPMCGSGTLLVEAGLMAADIAPGLLRTRFGFLRWHHHQPACWQELLAEAEARKRAGLAKLLHVQDTVVPQVVTRIRGFDWDSNAVEASAANIARAGLENIIAVRHGAVAALRNPLPDGVPGLVVTNPPYGHRLGEEEGLRGLYRQLGVVLKSYFGGWRAAVFTGNGALSFELGLRRDKRYRLFNGTIPSELSLFAIRERTTSDDEPGAREAAPAEPLTSGAQMLANRLRKNRRKLAPWLRRTQTVCYRLYDADLPEYAVAIDCYGEHVHVQEYQAPTSIGEDAARRHLREVRDAVNNVLAPQGQEVFYKQRRRQRHNEQYQRTQHTGAGVVTVAEGDAALEVNLSDYIDTGLFLDHRAVRRLIAEQCTLRRRQQKQVRFLNLFCYTATATVQAVLAGAQHSLSVDMSNAYLEWAQRNFVLNDLDPQGHQLLRADCIAWLSAATGEYDIILLDPPTFSNSKKMAGVLDIQKDHAALLEQAMGLLADDGVLVFSNNFRHFKMDPIVMETFQVEDVTAATIDKDFERNPRIHNCWLLTHGKSDVRE